MEQERLQPVWRKSPSKKRRKKSKNRKKVILLKFLISDIIMSIAVA